MVSWRGSQEEARPVSRSVAEGPGIEPLFFLPLIFFFLLYINTKELVTTFWPLWNEPGVVLSAFHSYEVSTLASIWQMKKLNLHGGGVLNSGLWSGRAGPQIPDPVHLHLMSRCLITDQRQPVLPADHFRHPPLSICLSASVCCGPHYLTLVVASWRFPLTWNFPSSSNLCASAKFTFLKHYFLWVLSLMTECQFFLFPTTEVPLPLPCPYIPPKWVP